MKNNKKEGICKVCGNDFVGRHNQLFCSDSCKGKNFKIKYGRNIVYDKNISRNTIGTISELIVASDLMLKGFSVFRALSQTCFCDLIAIKKHITYEVEVRTGHLTKNSPKVKFGVKKGERNHIYGVYEKSSNKIIYYTNDRKPTEII